MGHLDIFGNILQRARSDTHSEGVVGAGYSRIVCGRGTHLRSVDVPADGGVAVVPPYAVVVPGRIRCNARISRPRSSGVVVAVTLPICGRQNKKQYAPLTTTQYTTSVKYTMRPR